MFVLQDELFKFNSSDIGNGTSMANGVNENEQMDASSSLRVLLYFADFGLSLGTFLIAGPFYFDLKVECGRNKEGLLALIIWGEGMSFSRQ
jgi:hypothetical protein